MNEYFVDHIENHSMVEDMGDNMKMFDMGMLNIDIVDISNEIEEYNNLSCLCLGVCGNIDNCFDIEHSVMGCLDLGI
jgi:hypothetical protein